MGAKQAANTANVCKSVAIKQRSDTSVFGF
jgi:hypothetical protein